MGISFNLDRLPTYISFFKKNKKLGVLIYIYSIYIYNYLFVCLLLIFLQFEIYLVIV